MTTHCIYLNTNRVKYAAYSGTSIKNHSSMFKHKMHTMNNTMVYLRLQSLVDYTHLDIRASGAIYVISS